MNAQVVSGGRAIRRLIVGAALVMLAASGAKAGEWRTYGGDLGNTHYSPLDQISATNFDKLNYTGAEASLKFYGYAVSYTALHGSFNASQVVESKYTAYYPSHEAVASWEGAVKGGIRLRTRIGVVQRYRADPYALWDFYAARWRGRIHPFFQLTNITSTVYQEVAGVAMPKRAVLGGIEFTWRGL